ncbi:hypothetical protein SDRG_01521 [Saprolegnia diclina VS20]|uniref:Uncharacterized protein n=1 Tax=Saprolegnia diclina (strain VS20) TaxID=1156394 RepID=T0R5B5_SAPDV|nr:hypothetical protein SDRG_01521 [Saprolegnia diclina VS20]EQC41560.1 hypothetical protein SDRG_01521 [Saprolegnia diclina VS20]|eukprot:XP_008605274.1 hypothetical protein SDRG_01521 [Saprolegnia diclina VS20]
MSSNTPSEELRDAICDTRGGDLDALLAQGADANYVDEESGWALLLWAVKTNQPAAVATLLAHGANVNAADPSGNTALHKAAYLGHAECATLLLARGANADLHNKMQQTARDLALLFEKPEMAVLMTQ